ncbi:hypothetical protein MRX96_003393, partial [Rhipicephalus microplus]
MEDVQKHSVHTLVFRSLKRTHDMFLSDQANPPPQDDTSEKFKMNVKTKDEYSLVMHLVKSNPQTYRHSTDGHRASYHDQVPKSKEIKLQELTYSGMDVMPVYDDDAPPPGVDDYPGDESCATIINITVVLAGQQLAQVQRKQVAIPKPQWHPPWKLYRVISGHTGWVRCLAVEPGNQWFCTGSNDRIIKIWDLATGKLKLSLTGHISGVRGLAVSPRQPYLFSCGEDKQVKCWDLEYNKVIRHYHGHLSGVYALSLHPTIDILVTGGPGCDNKGVGHADQGQHPLAGGPHQHSGQRADTVVRATAYGHWWYIPGCTPLHLGGPDNIKQWKCPDGKFIQNLSGHNAIVNCLGINDDGVLVSGGDNGTLFFWDWRTGYNFQRLQAPVQPGSIDSEAGIFACGFDQSGSRLITAEADKTVKIFREDDTA